MRVLKFDRDMHELKAQVESLEDLWALQKLIEPKDVLEATSFRRFKSEDKLRPDSGEKKMVRLELEVESVEIAESVSKLRVSGKILSGSPPEFAQKGAFHTIDLEMQTVFKLRKVEFTAYHKKLVDEAKKKARQVRALIVVMDEKKALFATLRNNGVKFSFELENNASKRDVKQFEAQKKEFFSELLEAISSEKSEKILIASPGFAKDEFKKYSQDKDPQLEKTFLYDHVSSAEKTAVYELLKRGALETLVKEQKVQTEFGLLEKLKASLGKGDGLCCYGIEEVGKALGMRAVDTLMIEDALLRKNKDMNDLLEKAERSGVETVIFNSEDDAGREFSAFKIAALLRYRIE
ncbi:MAG TPA: mRNA surveillance protein pelota [Candidatus Norongarragalinales archaeon]|nr:mRNA surveillance protein pelota [Candidatus Norongarragalinales archaeon]